MLGEVRSIVNVNLKKIPKADSAPHNRSYNEASCQMTILNQIFFTNNKRAISRFFGTVVLLPSQDLLV